MRWQLQDICAGGLDPMSLAAGPAIDWGHEKTVSEHLLTPGLGVTSRGVYGSTAQLPRCKSGRKRWGVLGMNLAT